MCQKRAFCVKKYFNAGVFSLFVSRSTFWNKIFGRSTCPSSKLRVKSRFKKKTFNLTTFVKYFIIFILFYNFYSNLKIFFFILMNKLLISGLNICFLVKYFNLKAAELIWLGNVSAFDVCANSWASLCSVISLFYAFIIVHERVRHKYSTLGNINNFDKTPGIFLILYNGGKILIIFEIAWTTYLFSTRSRRKLKTQFRSLNCLGVGEQ